MDFGPALMALIAKLDAMYLAFLSIIGGCGYYHVVWRREDREDRAKYLDLMTKQADALNDLRTLIAAISGKPI